MARFLANLAVAVVAALILSPLILNPLFFGQSPARAETSLAAQAAVGAPLNLTPTFRHASFRPAKPVEHAGTGHVVQHRLAPQRMAQAFVCASGASVFSLCVAHPASISETSFHVAAESGSASARTMAPRMSFFIVTSVFVIITPSPSRRESIVVNSRLE